MVTQQQFKDHYRHLLSSGAIYLWGANGEIITKELVDRLYRSYGSSTYNRAYYDNKLKEGAGRIGADCSGSIYPLSKADNTARGYYNICKVKGSIKNLPKGTACLVFNAKFTHVGAYMGDGTTIEMRSSAMNVYTEKFKESRWAYYGIPVWLDTSNKSTSTSKPSTSKPTASSNKTKGVVEYIQKWLNSHYGIGLVEDGKVGPKTKAGLVKALQKYLNRTYKAGLVEDGIFGRATKKACKTVKNGASDLAFIAQALLYIKGYDMSHSGADAGKLDGIWGKGCYNATLKFQQNTRGLKHDGKCGPSTFQALCR